MNSDKKIFLFIKKYVLNPIYVLAGYSILLCSLLFYTNPFERFINPSFVILLFLFLFLRLLDDCSDYYKDLLNDRVLFSRKALIVEILVFTAAIMWLCFRYTRFGFIAVLALMLAACLLHLDFIKPFFVPAAFAFVIGYEFRFDVSNILIFAVSLIAGIFPLIFKKHKTYTVNEIGGKAFNLWKLNIKNTPAFIPIEAKYLNPPDEKKLECIVKMFCKRGKLYAVRSSAVDEDSAGNSFAGVHDTFLNVEKKDVLKKILEVAHSARTQSAIEYRKERGIDTENIQISVMIQEMVDADFAGVLNTINPVTNNISETVISVTQGLGDKLVDGSVDGTTYYIDGNRKEVHGQDILNGKVLKRLLKLADELRKKNS